MEIRPQNLALWSGLSRSLKVIENHTVRSGLIDLATDERQAVLWCDFLLVIYSNNELVSYRIRDKRRNWSNNANFSY